jgi:copper homeostasis protein
MQVMRQDVLMCRQLGADGVALGMLSQNGDIDATQLSEFMALCDSQARGMPL